MPKKAVFFFLLAAFLGAALFIYFTFPRTRDEIPRSNNQRPFPSAPDPNAPDTVPHPSQDTPTPHGPTLRVMAWATPAETRTLETEADAFGSSTGTPVSLTVVDAANYAHDLKQALASDEPPDVCLIDARDFSGADVSADLADVQAPAGIAPRSVSAFTVVGQVKAVPDEYSVDVLFYNRSHFDRAGLAYPDRHWNWDILEAIARALFSAKLHDAAGDAVYPLEMPATFDLWNVFCMQAGHAALDFDEWHLAEASSQPAQVRALDFIHEIFQGLTVTAPLPKAGQPLGRYFAQQRASLLIAPSETIATLPPFDYRCTVLPSDMDRANLARVNGWAVTTRSTQAEAARHLAAFLAREPVHAGWISPLETPAADSLHAIFAEELDRSLLPRVGPRTAPLVEYLDHQIDQLARNPDQKGEDLYAQISSQYQASYAPTPPVQSGVLPRAAAAPAPLAPKQVELRGL